MNTSIVGAGMSGCMMAIYLAQKGHGISLIERRPDMRGAEAAVGRSINLTLAERAIAALEEVGLKDSILRLTVPLYGRMVHRSNGKREFQSYGNAPYDKIYSITRGLLNNVLLDAVSEHTNVTTHFNSACCGIDKHARTLTIHDCLTDQRSVLRPDMLIGADGCFSTVREALHQGEIASHHQEFLDWGYKEIVFPARADGTHPMAGNVLHIWPRGNCVLMAMPNPDGTLTGTLCLPFEGAVSFRSLSDPARMRRFCEVEFPDAMEAAPGMVAELCSCKPFGFLTVTTDAWYYKDWAVLIGDACHTVLPFYGQGMNAAFQDCSLLVSQLSRDNDRERVFRSFQAERKPNTDALAVLSKQNFVELRDSVRSPLVGYRKKVDLLLNQFMPSSWVPLYTLVSHTTVSYVDAIARAERQRQLLRRTGVDAVLRVTAFGSTLLQPKVRINYDCGPVASTSLHSQTVTELQADSTRKTSTPPSPYAAPLAIPATETALALHTVPVLPAATSPPRPSSPTATTTASESKQSAANDKRRAGLSSLLRLAKGISPWAIVVAALAGLLTGGSRASMLALINSTIAAAPGDVNNYLLPFALLGILLLGSHIISRLLLVKFSQDVVYKLRMRLSRRVLAAPLRQIEKAGAPRLLSAMVDDVNVLANVLLSLPNIAVHGSTILVCMAYLGWLSPTGLGSLLLVMVIGALSYQVVIGRGMNRFRKAREDQNRLFGHLRSVTDGGKEFKLNRERLQAFVKQDLEPTAASYRRNSVIGNGIYSLASSWGQFIFFGYIALLLFWIAGLQGMDRSTLTGFTLVVLYVIIPLEMMLMLIPQLAGAKVAMENIDRIGMMPTDAEEQEDAPAAPLADEAWTELELIEIGKAYDGDGRGFRLGPISLSVKRGELVFVMGGNGSGKSTLAKLITGLYEADEGEIRLDGKTVSLADRPAYRQMFSAVFTDFHLLDGLRGLARGVSEQDIRKMLDQLGLSGKVEVRDGTFSTTALSTGQRKRLALLVALLENRRIYVFDEWAADQDPEFKTIFYDRLLPELVSQGKTAIVITHDERYLDKADRVLKLEDGVLRTSDPQPATVPMPESKPQAGASGEAASASTRLLRSLDIPNTLVRCRPPAEGVVASIGNTPLVRLRKLHGGLPFRLMAKLETANPGGSIKDRPARQIIEDAMAAGVIDSDTVIVEASSGNMGVGLAQICVYHGLRFICVVDKRTTEQNIQILKAYGATVNVVMEPHARSGDLLQAKLDRVQHLLETTPKSFWPNQYANLSNARSHHATMQELVEQCGHVDYLFCATSTCGTLRGCVEFVREHGLGTQIVAVDAVGSVIFGGTSGSRLIPGHGTARVPELFSVELTERHVHVTDLDCVLGCRRLLREEAILAGGSSGGIVSAILAMKHEIPDEATCVAVLADRGDRYLSTIYSDSWVEQHLKLDCSQAPRLSVVGAP